MNLGANLLQHAHKMKVSQKELSKKVQENEKTMRELSGLDNLIHPGDA